MNKIDLAKKAGFNKPLGGDVVFQSGGAELSAKALTEKAKAAAEKHPDLAGIKVNSLSVYAKPEEGMCYWVAVHRDGEVSGSFRLSD